MQNDMIPANDFCNHYKIEYAFIHSLQQYGLLQVTTIHETGYIPTTDLQKLERMVRLHYDMDINIEGIEAITNLLGKMEQLQEEMLQLQNRLKLYEG